MKAAIQNYHARMQRILEYIDQHLNRDLNLDVLNSVAEFSKFHFNRQF
ncbi:AraC-like DNA-binding protein [Novosphingobium sp. SG720]|nr:AraC-like DNA-binding protein [Novosphingobium sp. SG720]